MTLLTILLPRLIALLPYKYYDDSASAKRAAAFRQLALLAASAAASIAYSVASCQPAASAAAAGRHFASAFDIDIMMTHDITLTYTCH